MTAQYFLVLIETASNQRTIFQTNRLRENLGASELIHRVGTRYVLEALEKDGRIASNPAKLDTFLKDQSQNAPIEHSTQANPTEIVIATSGKAILVVGSKDRGKEIVTRVTHRALLESPGVTARGAVVPIHEASADGLDDAIYRAHLRHEELGSVLPSADLRFPALPFAQECRSSGLPSHQTWTENRPKGAIAATLEARRNAHEDAIERLCAALGNASGPARLPRNIQELEEKGYRWTAIVHADGNGLGQIFLNFTTYLAEDQKTFRHYIKTLREFSIGIDQCTRRAARAAIDITWPNAKVVPLIPIVLGGDDLTVICDGAEAIDFTESFLKEFEIETLLNEDVTRIAPRGLSACAGIAIVKPHFPFHRAYELSDDLIKEAKLVKKKAMTNKPGDLPCSAFDFQIVFDTSTGDLASVRSRMTARDDKKVHLTCRPYVVTEPVKLTQVSDPEGSKWLDQHRFGRLQRCKSLLLAPQAEGQERDRGGGLKFPRRQQHVLRAALQEGKAIADARLNEMRHRYPLDWKELAPGGSLFVEVDGELHTYLIDAMDLADLDAAGDGP